MSRPSPSAEPIARTVHGPRSLRRTLSAFRHGFDDPTCRLEPGRFRYATLTPDGPGTLELCWREDPGDVGADGLSARAWGPGAEWLSTRVPRLTGAHDRHVEFDHAHPMVERALRRNRTTRIGASGLLYHQLLPTVIAQRITGGEAVRQWARLCTELGEPAPGPSEVTEGMRLPPSPDSLDRRPAWWFHPLGIETKRARTLAAVAKHPRKLAEWAGDPTKVADRLSRLPGVGAWTIGSVLGPVTGDPDSVPVGDYHFPNTVAWALAGEARGDDDRMLELLEPYRGQRGRVLAAIVRTTRAPSFGPRQRILPMSRW
jgi:3-methyladenine DNA glycosylase/8-oxoguanine DNA glycosylase